MRNISVKALLAAGVLMLSWVATSSASQEAYPLAPAPLRGDRSVDVGQSAAARDEADRWSVTEHENDGVDTLKATRPVRGVSIESMRKARELYKNLRLARDASQHRDEVDARLGLVNAKSVVDAMYQPNSLRKLMQQTAAIRVELGKPRGSLNQHLWLPLQAQLDDYRISIPASDYDAAKQAVATGIAAVRRGERSRAQDSLGQIENILTRHFTLLPLDKIRGDLQAAENALDPYPPYWRGVTEAMQSALDSVERVTTTQHNDWSSAYMSAVEAIKAMPAEPDMARQWLRSTAAHLKTLQGGTNLAERAQRLAERDKPPVAALYDLIDNIGAHVSLDGSS